MNKSLLSSFLVNPYILNGLVWLLVLTVYQMGWSKLCAPLSDELTGFMIITIVASLIIGVITFRKEKISFVKLQNISLKGVKIWMIIFYLMLFAEIAAGGGVPLLGYLSGNILVAYDEFGIPVVHVVLVNGLSCLTLYLFYAFRSTGKGKLRKKIIIYLILGFLPFILMFNRGAIISILLGMFIISILAAKNTLRSLVKIVLGSFIILFAFGYLGNLRMGDKLSKVIMKGGKATKEFYDSPFPDEFFWAYLYMATPLANVQNTIQKVNKTSGDTEDLENLILYEFTPEMITKQIKGNQEKDKTYKRNRSKLKVGWLNATSVYGRVYKYLGWPGMWLMFGFTILFIFLNLKILPTTSKWYIPAIATLDEIIIMNLFDNMFIFMGMIPQLIIFVGLCYYQRFRRKSIR